MSIPKGDNVVTSNLSEVNFFFLKIVEINFKNKHHMLLFFLKDVMIAQKRIFILFTLVINIE
jgi:hypothetical protein